MTTPQEAHRYRALDTYRFIAASGVVFYHFENHFQPFLPMPTHALERFQLFVDFFFVLSGFVLAHTYRTRIMTVPNYLAFQRKRLARIYPLHLLTIALFLLVGSLLVAFGVSVRDRSFYDPSLLPANLLLIHAWGFTGRTGLNVPSWSISAEWFVYLLFPLLALVVRRCGGPVTLLVAVCIAVVVDILRRYAGLGPGETATIDFGNFRALPSFLAGMAVLAVVDRMPSSRISWWAPHACAAVVVGAMLAHAPSAMIVAAFPLLVALVATAERSGAPTLFASRIGVLLGHSSFAVYMIHTFFQVAAVIVARKLGWTSVPQLAVIAVVTYALIVGAGVVSYRWFENPLRRRFARDGHTGPTPRAALPGGLKRASPADPRSCRA